MQARVYTSMNNAHTNDEEDAAGGEKAFLFFRERKYKIIHSFSAAQFHYWYGKLQMYEFSHLNLLWFDVDFPLLFRFGHPKQWKTHKKIGMEMSRCESKTKDHHNMHWK